MPCQIWFEKNSVTLFFLQKEKELCDGNCILNYKIKNQIFSELILILIPIFSNGRVEIKISRSKYLFLIIWYD